MQLVKLFLRWCRRGAEQQIGGVLVLGEGYHLANGLGSDHYHQYAVDAGGNPAVGWGTVIESLQQVTEALLYIIIRIAHQLEDPFL